MSCMLVLCWLNCWQSHLVLYIRIIHNKHIWRTQDKYVFSDHWRRSECSVVELSNLSWTRNKQALYYFLSLSFCLVVCQVHNHLCCMGPGQGLGKNCYWAGVIQFEHVSEIWVWTSIFVFYDWLITYLGE